MMKKLLFIFSIAFAAITCCHDGITTSKITSLDGEKWYGAYAAKAFNGTPLEKISFQPYPENYGPKDLATDNNSNQSAPLLMSNLGRYIWSDDPFAFEFKDGDIILKSKYGKIQVNEGGNCLRDAYVTAMKAHFPPCGKTPDPLMFRAPQYNTWIELNYNQNEKDILLYAEKILSNGMPAGVFMIDDRWAEDYGTFRFRKDNFTNPKAMIKSLHDKGFKVMLWATPFVSPDSQTYRDLPKGYFVKRADTMTPAIIRWWNGYSACLDLENPEAIGWLRNQFKHLQEEYGVDGFKLDAVDLDFYCSASDIFPNEDTNVRGVDQCEAYTRLGTEFAFSEMRASWKNGNQPVAQRLQDKSSSWDDLKLLIPDMVSAGLIGHHFTCPDMIGGGLYGTFSSPEEFDQEYMVRSAQVQALMPMMQFSISPWTVLDEEHLAICVAAANLHHRMGDYIYSLAQKASQDGEPIVRHMEYDFPHQGFTSCDDQYMFGKYLVAPMINPGSERTVRLPEGRWQDENGREYEGAQTITISVPLDRIPRFVKID